MSTDRPPFEETTTSERASLRLPEPVSPKPSRCPPQVSSPVQALPPHLPATKSSEGIPRSPRDSSTRVPMFVQRQSHMDRVEFDRCVGLPLGLDTGPYFCFCSQLEGDLDA